MTLPNPYWKSDDGRHVIYNADCLTILPHVKADAVLTDPPYGIKRFQKGFGTTRFKGHGCEKNGITWDKKPDAVVLADMSRRPAVIWGGNNFQLPTSEYFLIWDKMQTVDNFASAEMAWTNQQIPAKVFHYSIHQHNTDCDKQHPTQKPVALMVWCLGFLKGETVLDPFMGSGTTGVACIRTGRRFIGIELEPKYCKISVERMERELAQPMLPTLAPTPAKQEEMAI